MVIMKKKKIASDGDTFKDYLILNISAAIEDYQLAYFLNQQLKIGFIKTSDLKVIENAKTTSIFSTYYFLHEYRSEFFLLKNINQQGALISGFFLIIKGFSHEKMKSDLMVQIEKIDQIIQIEELTFSDSENTARAKKNELFLKHLLNDLEFHILDMKRIENEREVTLNVEKPLRPKKLY